MGYHLKPKGAAIASIQPYEHHSHGKSYENWLADLGSIDGKRIRITRTSKADLLKAIDEYYAHPPEVKIMGERILTKRELLDIQAALFYLDRAKSKITFTELALDYIKKREKEVENRVTLLEAYELYYDSFNPAQEVQRHLVKQRIGSFVEAMKTGKMCDEVTAKDIIDYLDGMGGAVKTWNNRMTYIKSFFNWCLKSVRGYVAVNPIADLEQKVVIASTPEFHTPKEVATLFRWAEGLSADRFRDAILTRLTLSFFCGMRRAEIARMSASDIDLAGGSAVVRRPKGFTKGGAPRPFVLMDCAKKWLESVDINKGLDMEALNDRQCNDILREAKAALGVRPIPNGGRHSFITYHVAMFNEPSRTEGMVGTSAAMRINHYMGLAKHADAEEYFSLLPRAVA